MKEQKASLPQTIYIPGIPVDRATLKHSLNRLPVALLKQPDHICGEARRVGYTGKEDQDLALYRLKIKANKGLPTITLPGFFIIENGIFRDYEHWYQNTENDIL